MAGADSTPYTAEPTGHDAGPPAPPWEHRPRRDERPWRRFWARQVDYLLLALVLGVGVGFLAPGVLADDGEAPSTLLWSVASCFLWIFAESGFLWSTGTTPGKWMLSLRVVGPDGERPSFGRALRRSGSVFVSGVGLGIPLVSLFTMLHGYNTLREGGTPIWERVSGLRVESAPMRGARLSAAVATVTLVLGLTIWAEFFEDPWEQEARDSLTGLRTWMTDKAGERKIVVEAVGGVQSGEAVEGDVRRLPLQIPAAGWYAIVAGCDQSCVNLDLSVVAPWGTELGADRSSDAVPIVYLRTDAPERLDLEVEMVRCDLEPCAYAWQILRADSSLRFITESRMGSCFAVSPEGLVLTAHHLVEGAENVLVRFGRGEPLPAKIIELLPAADVALLRVDRRTTNYLSPADDQGLRLGQRIFTMGFPATDILGSEIKFSEGTVASLAGPAGEGHFFQMSVAIQPGNSGGPVVDESGRVVGVVSATAEHRRFEEVTGALPQGVNWAAKAASARSLFPHPTRATPAEGRAEAIRRVRQSVCFLETY